MNDRLAILFTNIWLAERGGSETVIRDLSLGMLRRGHRPIVYSPALGEVAKELVAKGIVVIDDLRKLRERPDILHAHHSIPCGEALIQFPDLPAIYSCHAFVHWVEAPVHFPQIAAYVATDEACRDRLVHAEGIDPARVRLMPNAIDLARVPPRPHPLMERPKRAIAFGKAAAVPELRTACEQLGIAFQAIGREASRPSPHPERELVTADLVFGSARCALEGLCCGCAVVVCDKRGISGLVTSDNYEALRARNFGLRSLGDLVTVEHCVREIQRYNPIDAARVGKRARHVADLEMLLDEFENLYAETLTGARRPHITPEAHERAVALFLHEYLPRRPGDPRWPWLQQRQDLLDQIQHLETRLAESARLIAENEQAWGDARIKLEAKLAETARNGEALEIRLAAALEEAKQVQQRVEETHSDFSRASRQLAALRQSRMLKLGRFLRKIVGRSINY